MNQNAQQAHNSQSFDLNPGQIKGYIFHLLTRNGYSDRQAHEAIRSATEGKSGGFLEFQVRAHRSKRIKDADVIAALIRSGHLSEQPEGRSENARAVNEPPHPAETNRQAAPVAPTPAPSKRAAQTHSDVRPQMKVHGSKAALTVCVASKGDGQKRDGVVFLDGPQSSIILEFAEVDPSKGKKNGKNQFGWDKKVSFSLDPIEALFLASVMMGQMQRLVTFAGNKVEEGIYHSYNNEHKKLRAELQGGNVYLVINVSSPQGKRNIGLPVGVGDRIRLSSFIMAHIRNDWPFFGMSVDECIGIGKNVLEQARNQMRQNRQRAGEGVAQAAR